MQAIEDEVVSLNIETSKNNEENADVADFLDR